jgi:hypothetical protein
MINETRAVRRPERTPRNQSRNVAEHLGNVPSGEREFMGRSFGLPGTPTCDLASKSGVSPLKLNFYVLCSCQGSHSVRRDMCL